MKLWAEQNPDKKVTLEPIGGDYFDRLLIQFSGGTVADVILFEGVLGLEFINEGLIIDIAPTLAAAIGLKVDDGAFDGRCLDLDAGTGNTCERTK